jgi:hypothetical protein
MKMHTYNGSPNAAVSKAFRTELMLNFITQFLSFSNSIVDAKMTSLQPSSRVPLFTNFNSSGSRTALAHHHPSVTWKDLDDDDNNNDDDDDDGDNNDDDDDNGDDSDDDDNNDDDNDDNNDDNDNDDNDDVYLNRIITNR